LASDTATRSFHRHTKLLRHIICVHLQAVMARQVRRFWKDLHAASQVSTTIVIELLERSANGMKGLEQPECNDAQGTGAKRTKAVGAPTAGGTPAARAAQQSPAGAIATGSGKLKQQRQQQLAAAAPQPQRKRQKQSASKAAAPRQPVATAEPASSDDDVELSDVELSDDSGEEALDVVPERQPVAAAPAANGATAKAAKRKRKAAAVPDGVADADADVDAAAPNALAAAGLETVPLSALRAANAANSAGAGAAAGGEAPFRNKEKVLLLTSRGIPPRCVCNRQAL